MLDLEFDFAFSFASEEREMVEQIYTQLKNKGYHIFYDNAYQSQLVGGDLYTALRDVYKNKGKYVVCFISESYTTKIWTNLEFTAVKERLMATFFAGDFLIPILINDAQIMQDIPSFIGFYRYESVDQTVHMLLDKITTSTIEDHFLSNINRFIFYLCDQTYHILKRNNVEAVCTNQNEISVSAYLKFFSLVFTPDPSAYASCIWVRKHTSRNRKTEMDAFPTFIITWKKKKSLLFSIHEFDTNTESSLKQLPLRDVLDYICNVIQSGLED